MFAVVEMAGKQYRVAVGDVLRVSSVEGKAGETIELPHVLLLSDGKKVKIGTPTVKSAVVKAKILSQGKGKKVDVRRFKSKVRYRRHTGMRPNETTLEILSIA